MRLPPWLWHLLASKRTHRALIIAPFALMVLATIAYVAADKWGEAKFEKQIAALKAEGIPVTLKEAYGPPPAPDDDVLQHPALLKELALPEHKRLKRLGYLQCHGAFKPTKFQQIVPARRIQRDVRQWADPSQHSAAEDEVARNLLRILQPFSDRLAELKPAFVRTRIGWVHRDEIGAPGFLYPSAITDFVGDLALLHLAANEPDAALEVMLPSIVHSRLYFSDHPCMLSVLIGSSIIAKADPIIWQGIVQGKWQEAQLAKLQAEIPQPAIDTGFLLPELALTAQMSRKAVDEVRKSFVWSDWRDEMWNAAKSRSYDETFTLLKSAWEIQRPPGLLLSSAADFLKNVRTQALVTDAQPRPSFSHAECVYFRAMHEKHGPEFSDLSSWHQLKLAAEIPLTHQTRTNLLRCGIALERYRLKYGKHPDSLDALVPELLPAVPKDVCDNQPLRYRVLPDGSPHVWSLWPSGKDEAGMPHSDPNKGNMAWTTGKIPGLTMSVYMR